MLKLMIGLALAQAAPVSEDEQAMQPALRAVAAYNECVFATYDTYRRVARSVSDAVDGAMGKCRREKDDISYAMTDVFLGQGFGYSEANNRAKNTVLDIAENLRSGLIAGVMDRQAGAPNRP